MYKYPDLKQAQKQPVMILREPLPNIDLEEEIFDTKSDLKTDNFDKFWQDNSTVIPEI